MTTRSRFSAVTSGYVPADNEPWVESPKVTAVVCHGTGKSVVTGQVEIVFNGANTVYIRTDAHHNDDQPALRYRDREWIASAHLTRCADGTWETTADRNPCVDERGADWSKTTAPTFRTAIVAALLATAAEHWTPERARAAVYAYAMQGLGLARKDRARAAEALDAAEAEVTRLETLAADHAPGKAQP